jgi:chemotaxis signal transduction protein
LTFRVARKDLALDASRVRAILPMQVLVPLEGARPDVLGIVNLSNSSAVVLDLAARLNLAAPHPRSRRQVIVVELSGGRLAGFVVDHVSDVIRYRARDLRTGILYGAGRARRLVEVDQLISEDDLVRLWSATN